MKFIRELNELGCVLALDNFGKGSSSVNHLKNFPISLVKIDKSLMPKNLEDSQQMALIKGLTLMVQLLKRDIVAEGIEEKDQIEVCAELGIKMAQGYYFSKAKSIEDIEHDILKAHRQKLATKQG